MKRILTDNKSFDALKPLFGSKGQPPYFDPNDLHSHVWKRGKLGIEDDPKNPTYSKSKINIRECEYCKICHTIKDSFQSTVGKNRDFVQDTLESPTIIIQKDQYTLNKQEIAPIELQISEIKSIESQPIEVQTNEKLFLKPEGIFDNYVKIEEENGYKYQ